MIIKQAKFITSAARADQFLVAEKPVIAVCGKSNVGKSTFINRLAGQKKLAKTSSEPGRTRLVNYFDFGEFILADLPGYGYAAVSKAEKEKWGILLERFFEKTPLRHVFALVDIRHKPTEDDLQMQTFLNYHIIPFTVIATKADKLSKMKGKERRRELAGELGLGIANIIVTSGETGAGKEEVLAKIEEILSLPEEDPQDFDGDEEE